MTIGREGICPVCTSTQTHLFLRRREVPLLQNRVYSTRIEALECSRGSLEMTLCEDCGFVFNRAFDAARVEYDGVYDNSQSCSPCFSDYLDGLVARVAEKIGSQAYSVIEIGCGKGEFLQRLIQRIPDESSAVGFDPSYSGVSSDLDGRLRFVRQYFDEESSSGIRGNVIVCRHVIEHVANPVALLRTARSVLGESKRSRFFVETPSVKWIFAEQTMWDVFYEHCSLFSSSSMSAALIRAGFCVDSVEQVFGEQYLWVEAVPEADDPTLTVDDRPSREEVDLFSAAEQRWQKFWERKVREAAAKGSIAVWGAGAKGVTFTSLTDSRGKWIDAVIDINPNKQGRYLAGSGHLIISPEESVKRSIETAFVMNPMYISENQQLLQELGSCMVLIDVTAMRSNEDYSE